MRHYYACDNADQCCKPYTICIGNTYDDITISSGSYLPINCIDANGNDEIGFGCVPICP